VIRRTGAGANRLKPLFRPRRTEDTAGTGGAAAISVGIGIWVGSGCEGFTGTPAVAGGKLGAAVVGGETGARAAGGELGTGGVGTA
jgi:hypothetical protein